MKPANTPAKPKEKANDVSLNIAQKFLETPAWDIAYGLLPKFIEECRKEQTGRPENWRKNFGG
jgi:hypothetical protein